MKHTYEKPMAVSVNLADADILTLSGNTEEAGALKSIDWKDLQFN